MEKYKFTIKTARAKGMNQYGSREIVTCIYSYSYRCFEQAMIKASKYALMQCIVEDCDSIISVEVVKDEEDA